MDCDHDFGEQAIACSKCGLKYDRWLEQRMRRLERSVERLQRQQAPAQQPRRYDPRTEVKA